MPPKSASKKKVDEKAENQADFVKPQNVIAYMSWRDFIPIKTIQALCRHTIAVSFASICFALTGLLASWLFPAEPMILIIHWIEYVGIFLILIYLLIEFFIEIIKGKGNDKTENE